MKLELTSTKNNPIMGRKELIFRIEEPSTPRRADVRREVAVMMRTDVDKVYVRSLTTTSGTRVTTGVAHVYNDAAKALKVEPKHIVARNNPTEKAENAEETPNLEEKPEEKPKEKPKEVDA
jgi:ribosomal protein S24E